MKDKIMNWLRSGRHRVAAAIGLTITLAILSTCVNAESVSGVKGLNGVEVNKAIVVKDPRGLVSYCVPDEGEYVCIHFGTQEVLAKYQNGMIEECIIATIPEHGPELVCGQYKDRVEKEGIQWIIDAIQKSKGQTQI